jgi:hypothetical protein
LGGIGKRACPYYPAHIELKQLPLEDSIMAKKKLRSRVTEEDSRVHQKSTGPNSRKTRNDVPSTHANKVASGKQVRASRAKAG